MRYAFKKSDRLIRLHSYFNQRFNLYCGQTQRSLSDSQVAIMRQVAEYIANEGAVTVKELNSINADLWRKGILSFGKDSFAAETESLSKLLLEVA